MEEMVKKEVFSELLKSWRLRFWLAGIIVSVTLMLPEAIFFRRDVLRCVLMCLAVSILIYPAFSKVVQYPFLAKRIRYALAWCVLCPLLWASIAAIDLFYLDEIILAVAFFMIVLFLAVFWLLFEVSLLLTRQPEGQQQLSLRKQYPTEGTTSESSPFLTRSQEDK